MDDTNQATFDFEPGENGRARLILHGRLDRNTTASIWQPSTRRLREVKPQRLVVQADDVTYCDGAGVALLTEYQRIQQRNKGQAEIVGLQPRFVQLMALFETEKLVAPPRPPGPITNFIRSIGMSAAHFGRDFIAQVAFTGEAAAKLVWTLFHPGVLRWKDTFIIAEKAGANAVSITGSLGFLIGLILAFQMAAAIRQFGAEVYVADFTAVVLFRELGPLITAIILTSRTASAFAAEVGTMKVNEEIDALVTMGLDPVQFLVVPRLVAVICVIPLLTVFNEVFGLLGAWVVMRSWDIPTSIFLERIRYAATLTDFLVGLIKTFFFGALIAGIGCLRGLQTGIGPTAVGDSTTRAVVSGIIAIIVTDGIFTVIFYILGV
jgi:phospholipid/cholesterol/gamma-HCH transport system permease protein